MKALEDYAVMGKLVTKQLTEHHDIIQIYDHKAVEKVEKYLIHHTLKGRGCVRQSEGHNSPFEESKMYQQCRVRLVCWYNLYLVIPLG